MKHETSEAEKFWLQLKRDGFYYSHLIPFSANLKNWIESQSLPNNFDLATVYNELAHATVVERLSKKILRIHGSAGPRLSPSTSSGFLYLFESNGYIITANHSIETEKDNFELLVSLSGVEHNFNCKRIHQSLEPDASFDIVAAYFDPPTKSAISLASFFTKSDLLDYSGPDVSKSCHALGFPVSSNKSRTQPPRLMSRPTRFVEKPDSFSWYKPERDILFWTPKDVVKGYSESELKIAKSTRGMSGGPIACYGQDLIPKIIGITTREISIAKAEAESHGAATPNTRFAIGVGERLVPFLRGIGLY